jgi:hypothetical protein
MCTEVWCHNCCVPPVSGTCDATTALSLLSQVPVVPQLLCPFYLRYLWCHNCSISSISGTCGATTALYLLSQVPVVPQLLRIFYLRYLWCHSCSVSSVSGTCGATVALFPLSETALHYTGSSCHIPVRTCTSYARCCLPSLFVTARYQPFLLYARTTHPRPWRVGRLW